jgi:ribose transport system permease protein
MPTAFDKSNNQGAKGPSRNVGPSWTSRWAQMFAFQNVSALYLLVLVVIVFAIWIPDLFLNTDTFAQVLNENAAPGIIALALVVPLAAGIYDLSIGYTLGAVSVFVAYLLGHTDLAPAFCILLGLLLGFAIGCVNGFIVVVLKVESFIATLASGSLLEALILIVSGDTQQTEGITKGFTDIARDKIGNFTLPVFFCLIIAAILWFFLEHRAIGRQTHASGLAPEASRLAGIRVDSIRFVSLIVSALLAAVAGILITATVGGGSPTVGPAYLIPAFAAAFLGATQLKGGLFNAWGTILAVILLGTTYTGLTLAGVPIWMPYVVTGVVLIAALAMAGFKRRSSGGERAQPDDSRSEMQASGAESGSH